MKVSYSLKVSQPTQFVQQLVKHLQETYDMETAYGFKPLLGKINDLRNKATSINLKSDASDQQLDRTAQLISAYTKYALIILKRFNWDTNRGKSVQGVQLTWFDSFQPGMQFTKNTILFDIFCCYYNLAIIYFTRAMRLGDVDLDTSRKEAMTKAKYAAYLLNEMKEKFYGEFTQVGFHDTQYPHLDMLYNLCMGLIYKCLFNTFKESEFKLGINKIAAISGMAAKYYFKAYNAGSAFFANPSGISDVTKTQLLSLSYLQSLYFDVATNTRYAKYYQNLLQSDHSQITVVIAYQRKALRLLQIGLKNQSVQQLFNTNKQQKNDLLQMQTELKSDLQKNIQRNTHIYKQAEIQQTQIPPPEDIPKEWIVKLISPPNLVMENQGEFSKLMSDESYMLALELSNFSASRKAGLESSQKKLDEEIEKAFNDSYVNFFLQIQGESVQSNRFCKVENIPKNLQEKLLEIRKKGGKPKLEQEMKMIKENQNSVRQCFQNLRKTLKDEEALDGQKRQFFGNMWARPPSNQVNGEYFKNIDNLQGKFKIAENVDHKITDKYNRCSPIIETLNSSDEQIAAHLPQPQAAKFLQANKMQLNALREKNQNLKKHRQQLRNLGAEILDNLQKINYPKIANQSLGQNISKQQIFKTVFQSVQTLINQFNAQCKTIKQQVGVISTISLSLNGKNKQQDNSKREFEKVINSYNEVSQLYSEMQQASAFYTKLNDFISKLTAGVEDFVYARKIGAEELETNIKNRKGGGGFNSPNFPNMYPGQANNPTVPSYSGPQQSGFMNSPPPPSAFNFNVQQQQNFDPRNAGMPELFRMLGDSFNQLNPFK